MYGSNVISGSGILDRMIYIDISPGADLIDSILEACEEHTIHSGLIVYCIGSLQYVHIESVAIDPKYPTGAGITSPMRIEGPIQVLSGQGSIALDENKKHSVHLHISFVEGRSGTIFGGHIEQGKNPALNRLEIGIVSVQGMLLEKKFDPRTDHYHVVPSQV